MTPHKVATVFLFCMLIFTALEGKSAPVLDYNDYDSVLDFTGKKVVLIQKGDDSSYKEVLFDDSRWTVISLPHNWTKLYPEYKDICWYRFHVRFPEKIPRKTIGLRLGVIYDTDEVFFNGILIGKTGEFPPNRVSSYDRKRIYEIPSNLIKPGADNVIAVRIAGLFYNDNGPSEGRFQLAPMQDLQRKILAKSFFDVFFIVIYIAVSFYFLLLFVKQRDEWEYLHFALFCLTTASYLFLRTQVKFFLTDNFMLLKRLEYIFLFVLFVFLLEYIIHHFEERRNISHYVYEGITLVCLPFVIFSNDVTVWLKVLNYAVQPSWLIPIIFYLYVLFKEFKRDSDAKYILGALFILLLTTINDVLVHRKVYEFLRLSNYGFIFLILGIAIIMRNRYVSLHREIEEYRSRGDDKKEITSFSRDKAEEAIEYIKNNFKTEITREDIADDLAINPDHLGKIFKKHTGTRINDYINSLRVKEAAEQLLETDNSITYIAFTVGFESLSTFYRVFQKQMGESPKSFREKKKSDKKQQ